MVLAAPGRTLEETQSQHLSLPVPRTSWVGRVRQEGSFLGREGSQTQWEVPGSPTQVWWQSCSPHPTHPHQLVPSEGRSSF